MKSWKDSKIWRILNSRFKKQNEEQWIKDRRIICAFCKWNSKNVSKIGLKGYLMIFLSYLYDTLTFSDPEDLGTCTDCGCNLYYKTAESSEKCGKEYWSIYIPNQK